MMTEFICSVECEDGMKECTITANEYADRFDLEWMACTKLVEDGEVPLIDGKFKCRQKTIWDTLGGELAIIEKHFDELCDKDSTTIRAGLCSLFSQVCSFEGVRFGLEDVKQDRRGRVTHYVLNLL